MGENVKFQSRAPYNFVSFRYQPIRRYQTPEELPPHDVTDAGLLSGEIRLTMTAQTPVLVADGNGERFVTDADGNYQIPGSTLRGLIRQNMQILGRGLVRSNEDYQDRRLMYRSMADPSRGMHKKRKWHYTNVLGIQSFEAYNRDGEPVVNPRNNRAMQYSVAQNVLGGYLHRNRDRYTIVPVQGKVFRISRKSPLVDQWRSSYTFTLNVYYQASETEVTALQLKEAPGYRKGVLLSPGFMWRQNSVYLFPEEDPNQEVITLTDEDRLTYQEDLEWRTNTLRGTQNNMEKRFWELPRDGERKPVFYLQHHGMTVFGMSQFMRLSYDHRLSEGLFESHRIHQEELFLDYPYALMGYTGKDGNYRSRIQVGNLKAAKLPGEPEPVRVTLGEPKPSFFPNYTFKGLDYNQQLFQLNGYKQYWMKDPDPQTSGKDNVSKTVYPLPAGTQFSGTVRYRNLHPDELGLLLWCLRLEKNCFQTVGMGKPYGYGRMKLSIDALVEDRPEELYATLGAVRQPVPDTQGRVAELIAIYQRYGCGFTKVPICEGLEPGMQYMGHIKDFLHMKRWIFKQAQEVSYLRLDEHKKVEVSLKPLRSFRLEGSTNR